MAVVKLLQKSNHGEKGQVVSLQDETAQVLIIQNLATLDIAEPEEDDCGDEPGSDDTDS